ncbi:MAG: outer membrane lipoprotein-sorting protein [Pseudodesulfovibrio sp.]|nr:outer membrane lipoprotein-sorting protein [Pseudodesulfovibrio sp.]
MFIYLLDFVLFMSLAASPLLAIANSSWAFSGRDVAVKMDQVDSSSCGESGIVMMVRRGDEKLVRMMSMKKKKFLDCEKQLIRFSEPCDVRDTSYLTWSYKDVHRDDDMWIYMPAASLVRRISGGGKKGSFMRSDFANEDVAKREVDDDRHTLLREEDLYGASCFVVEMIPVKPEDTNYSKRIVWVRKDMWLSARVDFYDKSGALFKRLLYGGFKQIQGIWTPTRQRMKSLSRDSETLLETRKIQYETGLSDEVFLHSDLKR